MRNRSAIIGYALLTVILTAGAAQGLAGTDTVFSDDVVNETLTSADVKNEALTSSDIKNESVRGSDVLNNSLTGSDVNEATLARARHLQFAHVDKDGNRIRGTASSADQNTTGQGEYEVTFPAYDVRTCVWSGSVADFPGGDSLVTKRILMVDSDDSSSRVTVQITDSATGASVEASFALVGMCP